ncbi:nucleotidyl transferase AbiEii/AbiGii toxin family protein [Rhodococcus sp. KBS0724]|nr:nucleotidyl transferase AbiEii/AbiGii toxin family protein [Rhodococcus sp. KBS0724]
MSSRPVMLWRNENESIFSQTVAAAASKLNISELAVAKDYWVCEALRAVVSHAADDLVFKGGTSLEKMRLVQRFSEDLDLLVTGRYGNKRATERALKRMCEAAADAIPGAVALKPENGSGGEKGAEGTDDSFWRKVYIEVPLAPELDTMGIADPTRIMLEFGQAGGPTPTQVMPVTSLLGRELEAAGVPIAAYPDLASFEVRMLHPGRTLIEKLLRMNNFVARTRGGRGQADGWSRIGRQLYDVWALLGDHTVLELLSDKETARAIVRDCIVVSQAYPLPDEEPPVGGFAASEIFSREWRHSGVLRVEHEKAMRGLYYGVDAPSFDVVLDRVEEYRSLLDVNSSDRT